MLRGQAGHAGYGAVAAGAVAAAATGRGGAHGNQRVVIEALGGRFVAAGGAWWRQAGVIDRGAQERIGVEEGDRVLHGTGFPRTFLVREHFPVQVDGALPGQVGPQCIAADSVDAVAGAAVRFGQNAAALDAGGGGKQGSPFLRRDWLRGHRVLRLGRTGRQRQCGRCDEHCKCQPVGHIVMNPGVNE